MSVQIGVDLGKVSDYTGIVVAETYWPESLAPGDRPRLRHRLRWIERLPLGVDYQLQVDRIALVAEQSRALGSTSIIIDATGLGRPVVDLLRRSTSVTVRPITFTSGEHEAIADDGTRGVPKADLEAAFELVYQSRRWEHTPDCPGVDALVEELRAMRRKLTIRGHVLFEASLGAHDDLVMALWLAVWWGERTGGDAWGQWERLRAADPARYGPRPGDQLG